MAGVAAGAGRRSVPWLPEGGLRWAVSARGLIHPPLLAAGLVLVWVLVAWWTNTAQYGDHFEQLSWAQSMEWGYHKHPPLPSWLLAAAIRVGGLHAWWPSVLAGGCIALNLVLTWRIACWLIGEDRAGLAVLFAGLQQGFMGKAQLFNHNSVLVVCVSAVVLLALRATQLEAARPARQQTLRWALVGVVAGLAMLSKYQAALPLIGVVVAMWRSGALARPANRQGLALAVVIALLMLAPHVAWVATHGWSTVAYATQSGVSQSAGERLAGVVKFLVIQLRVLSPALLMLALVAGWSGRRGTDRAARMPQPVRGDDRPAPQWIWLSSLLGVPVAGVLVAALMGGLRLGASRPSSSWASWRLRSGPGRCGRRGVAAWRWRWCCTACSCWPIPRRAGRTWPVRPEPVSTSSTRPAPWPMPCARSGWPPCPRVARCAMCVVRDSRPASSGSMRPSIRPWWTTTCCTRRGCSWRTSPRRGISRFGSARRRSWTTGRPVRCCGGSSVLMSRRSGKHRTRRSTG